MPWAQKTIELLLYREAPGKEHFMLIYDGRKFEGCEGARLGELRKQGHSFSSIRCPRCGRPFKNREGLDRHQAGFCSENAGERFSTVRMPDASKPAERLLRFKASNACEMAPQMTYVDAEVFSSKPPQGLEAASTHRKQHRLASLAYCTLVERHKMWLDRCEEGNGPSGASSNRCWTSMTPTRTGRTPFTGPARQAPTSSGRPLRRRLPARCATPASGTWASKPSAGIPATVPGSTWAPYAAPATVRYSSHAT